MLVGIWLGFIHKCSKVKLIILTGSSTTIESSRPPPPPLLLLLLLLVLVGLVVRLVVVEVVVGPVSKYTVCVYICPSTSWEMQPSMSTSTFLTVAIPDKKGKIKRKISRKSG